MSEKIIQNYISLYMLHNKALLRYLLIQQIKNTVKKMKIKKISRNFLACYYGLSSEELNIVIKILRGIPVNKKDIARIFKKILDEEILNFTSQHFHDITLIIYVNNYKINLTHHVTRNITNHSKYTNWTIRNNARTIKKPCYSRTN